MRIRKIYCIFEATIRLQIEKFTESSKSTVRVQTSADRDQVRPGAGPVFGSRSGSKKNYRMGPSSKNRGPDGLYM